MSHRTSDTAYRRARHRIRYPGVVCALCGQEIDLTLGQYDPRSFTADHVEAVAKGGDNLGPLVPMHRHCNLTKGTKDLESVRHDPHSQRHY
jgi:hypothetical protein